MREFWFQASDGTRLFALERGDGPAIILLHGGLADHRACAYLAEPLAERFRVITPDLRASGRSHHHGPLTWDLLADDIAALARHLDLVRAAVGGVSFGTGVALRTALRHPALVSALLLVHPVYAGTDRGLTSAQSDAMRTIDAAACRAPTDGIDALLPLLDTLPPAIRERARTVVLSLDPLSVAALSRFMSSGAQPFRTAADLAAITCPTLLIAGVDPQHPAALADLLAAHLPRATISSASDHPAAIAAFLAALSQDESPIVSCDDLVGK